MPFAVLILSPERTVFELEDASYLLLPGAEGELAVQPDHAPTLLALTSGPSQVRFGAGARSEEVLSISGGFARIDTDRVLVLADAAERGGEIDVERARRAKERAEKRLASEEDIDEARAQAALQRALARLSAAARHREE